MIALDTSVGIPLLLDNHELHAQVRAWRDGRPAALVGHAAIETYSVLTRMPRRSRVEPGEVRRAMRAQFAAPLSLSIDTVQVIDALAALNVQGGAVYDALVALTAREHDCVLATLDLRARNTYVQVGADVVVPA